MDKGGNMKGKELRGIILFLIIIVIEIGMFWGSDIMTLISPNSYFTEQNIRTDIKSVMRNNEDSFILNEKATEPFSSEYLGKITIDSIDIQENRCDLEISTTWEGSKNIKVEYTFSIVYTREEGKQWKIVSFKSNPNGLAEGLIGSWEGNISHDGDFFTAKYNYDLVYQFERIEGEMIYGTVTARDCFGVEADDTVSFTATWNARNCVMSIVLERPVSSKGFDAGNLFYDPVDGALKSESVVYAKSY